LPKEVDNESLETYKNMCPSLDDHINVRSDKWDTYKATIYQTP